MERSGRSDRFLTRRRLLAGAGFFAAGAGLARASRFLGEARGEVAIGHAEGGVLEVGLDAAERPQALPCFDGRVLPLWTLSADSFLPVLRLKAGDTLRAHVANSLPREGEHISIHWHGIRLPNGQDGVPYLTQTPIPPGESFSYEFVPPDTGTFFFHTHCNTAEQLGRGMAGIFIVEGDETEPYDAEHLIVLRDWSVGETGLGPFVTDEAARAGTFGTIRSCNGESEPALSVPASADVRLRILNIDRTRMMQLGIEGAECAVVAIDGLAVAPFPLTAWFAPPAQRLDVVMRSPAAGVATLFDYFAPQPVPLAHFASEGEAVRAQAFDPAPLAASIVPEPDLAAAERQTFRFSATATGQSVAAEEAADAETPVALDDLCTTPRTFWAINKQAWPGRDHKVLPPPIATLSQGRSYIFELRNDTPHMHPIHIHGHSFKVLSSNKRDLPVHHADTILLQAKERIEAAFVADNPGDWMFHCHIIEHQETGMMSYLRVA